LKRKPHLIYAKDEEYTRIQRKEKEKAVIIMKKIGKKRSGETVLKVVIRLSSLRLILILPPKRII